MEFLELRAVPNLIRTFAPDLSKMRSPSVDTVLPKLIDPPFIIVRRLVRALYCETVSPFVQKLIFAPSNAVALSLSAIIDAAGVESLIAAVSMWKHIPAKRDDVMLG
jgi:hypothetical protein